jgi:hypothetical protein
MFSISILTCCSPSSNQTDTLIVHEDSFYNINHNEYPLLRLPLINPIEATREDGRTPWRIFLNNGPFVQLPNRSDLYYYVYSIEELEKFAVINGVIMGYSEYVDQKADPYIRDNYYHWFVVIPDKEISKGFTTEDEFNTYIKSLGITDPKWVKPDDAYALFEKTGCLEWIPDCN